MFLYPGKKLLVVSLLVSIPVSTSDWFGFCFWFWFWVSLDLVPCCQTSFRFWRGLPEILLVFRVWGSFRFAFAARVFFSSRVRSLVPPVDVRFCSSFLSYPQLLCAFGNGRCLLGDHFVPSSHGLFSIVAAREERRRILLPTPLHLHGSTVTSGRRPLPRSTIIWDRSDLGG